MILLKNEKQILPLDTKKSIAVIGDFAFSPRYQGAGSSMVNPTKVEDMSSILQQYDLNILGMTRGYQRNGDVDENDRKFALNLSMNADICDFSALVLMRSVNQKDWTELICVFRRTRSIFCRISVK